MQDLSLLLTLVPLAVLVLGFIAIIFAEMSLLKKKGWVDEKQANIYPAVVGLVNIPVGVIAYFIGSVITMGLGFFGIQMIGQLLGDNNEKLSLAVYFLASGIIVFFLFLVAFAVVRVVISLAMVRSSSLTWKYWLGQAVVLAVFFASIHIFITASVTIVALSQSVK